MRCPTSVPCWTSSMTPWPSARTRALLGAFTGAPASVAQPGRHELLPPEPQGRRAGQCTWGTGWSTEYPSRGPLLSAETRYTPRTRPHYGLSHLDHPCRLLVRNFYAHWQCSTAMGGRLSYRWPDGWTPVGGVKDTGVYMLLESDKKRRAFMIIMRHAEGKRLAVVVRGTETVPEWMIGVGAGGGSPAHPPSPAVDATAARHLAQLQVTSGASRRLRSPTPQSAA